MIRKATKNDTAAIAILYDKVIDYQNANGSYMSWIKGVYPTEQTAIDACALDTLYVFEEGGNIKGSVILDCNQPTEYENISWKTKSVSNQALVIHTLCVDPEYMGMGIASEMLTYSKVLAKSLNCASIRLATNSKNVIAISLYEKNEFITIGYDKVLLDGKINCPKQCFMEYIL